MLKKSSKLIPLAKLVRRHGIPKDGIVRLKADLFNVGGEIFRSEDLTAVSVSKDLTLQNAREVSLAGPSSPLGGGWGRATGVIFAFRESDAPEIPSVVSLARESLAVPLEGEFYVHDALESEVVDENARVWGRVSGFFAAKPGDPRSVNLRARYGGVEYEFPSAWIERFDFASKRVHVPGVEAWVEAAKNSRTKPDDGDDE